MAEDFPAVGIHGGAWWSSPKSVISPTDICMSPCSMGFGANGFGFPDMKSSLSCTDNIIHGASGNNSNVFGHKLQGEADSDSGGSTVTIDSTLQMTGLGFSTSSTSDWSQALLQEDMNIGSTSQDHSQGLPSSSLLQSFYESESNPSLLNNNNSFMISCPENPQLSWPKPEPFLKPMLSSSLPNYGCNGFSNSTNAQPFWSSSNPNLNNIPPKRGNSVVKKVKSDERATKKPRITATRPSPLPALKVRKENLRDQITALQQLVSPFGKTDTASVLQEALEYIKFLHDQVTVLCTPYLKQDNAISQQRFSDKRENPTNQELKSQGLCLVPISSTIPIANETTADFWTPTFGGNNLR